jgi:hypothetical protein
MRVSHDLLLERSNLLDLDMRDVKVDTSASPPLSPTISKTWGVIGDCRRPSAVVNSNCVTNRVAPGSRYKLSYRVRARDARIRVMRAITKTPL